MPEPEIVCGSVNERPSESVSATVELPKTPVKLPVSQENKTVLLVTGVEVAMVGEIADFGTNKKYTAPTIIRIIITIAMPSCGFIFIRAIFYRYYLNTIILIKYLRSKNKIHIHLMLSEYTRNLHIKPKTVWIHPRTKS
jgi:hypothetical protein